MIKPEDVHRIAELLDEYRFLLARDVMAMSSAVQEKMEELETPIERLRNAGGSADDYATPTHLTRKRTIQLTEEEFSALGPSPSKK